MWVLPYDCAALSQADAHSSQAVFDFWMLLKLSRQLNHQANTRSGERMPNSYRATPCVHARIVIVKTERVQKAENLHSEGLVQFEQTNIIDAQPSISQGLSG